MYNSIYGEVTYILDNTLYLLCNSIEYDITCPSVFLQELKLGQFVKVWTVLHHKEDVMKLFGFKSSSQRELFFQFLKVDGVGPKQAINILSYSDVDTLKEIIETEDLSSLTKIQGLGNKTASKIILALRGKLTSRETTSKSNNEFDDIIKALVDMGFPQKSAETTVIKCSKQIDKSEKDFEKNLFRLCIVEMSSM